MKVEVKQQDEGTRQGRGFNQGFEYTMLVYMMSYMNIHSYIPLCLLFFPFLEG